MQKLRYEAFGRAEYERLAFSAAKGIFKVIKEKVRPSKDGVECKRALEEYMQDARKIEQGMSFGSFTSK